MEPAQGELRDYKPIHPRHGLARHPAAPLRPDRRPDRPRRQVRVRLPQVLDDLHRRRRLRADLGLAVRVGFVLLILVHELGPLRRGAAAGPRPVVAGLRPVLRRLRRDPRRAPATRGGHALVSLAGPSLGGARRAVCLARRGGAEAPTSSWRSPTSASCSTCSICSRSASSTAARSGGRSLAPPRRRRASTAIAAAGIALRRRRARAAPRRRCSRPTCRSTVLAAHVEDRRHPRRASRRRPGRRRRADRAGVPRRASRRSSGSAGRPSPCSARRGSSEDTRSMRARARSAAASPRRAGRSSRAADPG